MVILKLDKLDICRVGRLMITVAVMSTSARRGNEKESLSGGSLFRIFI